MKVEERFKGGKDHRDFGINEQTYGEIKHLLGYQIKNEYYLVLPTEIYYPLALLLALCKTNSFTKKLNTTLAALELEERSHLESTYFQANDKQRELIVPDQFEQCEGKFNYNISLFQKHAHKFNYGMLNKMKEDNSGHCRIRKFQQKGAKGSKKQCNNEDVLLIQQGNQMIIACFSDKESQALHKRVMQKEKTVVEKANGLKEGSRIMSEKSDEEETMQVEGEKEEEKNQEEDLEENGATVSNKWEWMFFGFSLFVLIVLMLAVIGNRAVLDVITKVASFIPNWHVLETLISVLSESKK